MLPFSITVEPITLLYVTAINCEYTLIQYSVSTSHCLSLTNLTDPTICESPKSANVSALIKDDVTISMRYYNLVLSLCCSLATLFTGSWSDYYGRRLPMKFALISSMLAQILCIIFWITLDRNWIWFIYAAGLVSGISGSSSSLIANCFGYTADITSVEARSKAMATMEAMLYLGNAIGFTTGSLVLKTFGSQLAIGFSILFLIHTSLFIYVLFYLRESKSSTDKITLKGLFRLSHVATVFRTLAKPRSQPYKKFWLLTIIGCAFIATLGSNAMTSIIYVFLRNAPLHWTSEFYGYLQASNYTLGGCTLLILVPLTQRFFPRLVNDDLFALLGFISRSTGLVVLGLATTDLHAFLSPLGFILSELTLPSIRSSLSKIVEDDEKGKAFAFLGLLSNFTFLIGSQISSFIYYRTSSRFPGLVFIILGIMELIPATIFFIKYKFFNKAFTGKKQADSNSNLSSRSSQDRQDSRINSKDELDHSDIDVTLTTGLDKLSHASLRAKTKEKESESKRTEC